MECPVCQKSISAGAAFCAYCGASMAAPAGDGFTPVSEFSSGPSPEQPFIPTPGYTAPAGSYAPPGAHYAPPPPNYPPPPPHYPGSPAASSSGLSNPMAAALAYVTIIPAIVFLVLAPYNRIPLVRFHSFQSISLFVAAVVVHIAITVLQVALHFVPGIFFLFAALQSLVSLAFFIIWLIAILKASKGEWYKLPLLGDFAEKQARS